MRLNNVKDLKISSTTNHICGLKLNEKNETRKKRVCARETFYYCKFSFLTESIWRCTCIIISMLSIIILLIKCPTVRNSREKNNPKFWCSHSLCETCLLSIHYVHYHFFIQRAFASTICSQIIVDILSKKETCVAQSGNIKVKCNCREGSLINTKW